MKRAAGLAFSAIFLASMGSSMTYYALEIQGGSRLFSLDPPVRKGRQVLFHRYPDGVYVSLAAEEVLKVTPHEEPPAPTPAPELAPGQARYVGPVLEGPGFEAPPAPARTDAYDAYVDSGYGYYGYSWGGGYVPPLRPPRPPRPVPSNIGPNGYPILAPPGSPGSAPPRIGPNGYPIL